MDRVLLNLRTRTDGRAGAVFATVVFGAAGCGYALAEDTVLTKEQLVERHPELSPEDIANGPIGTLYEVKVGGQVNYVTTDGHYLIRGDVIDLDSRKNLTEARRNEIRAVALRSIDPASEIVFTPANGIVTHRITVFTDVDCGYCRQLHRDIATVNALGIEVRYVSYPRTGPNTESWTRAEHVWCAANRNEALTNAKLGADIPATAGCAKTPVAEHYALGRRIGLSGTPGVYAEDGTELGGYLPPAQLLEQLEKVAAAK